MYYCITIIELPKEVINICVGQFVSKIFNYFRLSYSTQNHRQTIFLLFTRKSKCKQLSSKQALRIETIARGGFFKTFHHTVHVFNPHPSSFAFSLKNLPKTCGNLRKTFGKFRRKRKTTEMQMFSPGQKTGSIFRSMDYLVLRIRLYCMYGIQVRSFKCICRYLVQVFGLEKRRKTSQFAC